MSLANYNKQESSLSKGGESVIEEKYQNQEESTLIHRERVLIQKEEQRSRANSI